MLWPSSRPSPSSLRKSMASSKRQTINLVSLLVTLKQPATQSGVPNVRRKLPFFVPGIIFLPSRRTFELPKQFRSECSRPRSQRVQGIPSQQVAADPTKLPAIAVELLALQQTRAPVEQPRKDRKWTQHYRARAMGQRGLQKRRTHRA
jgi:hypothetical protein